MAVGANFFGNASAIVAGTPSDPTQNANLTIQDDEPVVPGVDELFRSAWWWFEPVESGWYSADTELSSEGTETILAIYAGLRINNLTLIDWDDNSGANSTSKVSLFYAYAGYRYYFQVSAPTDVDTYEYVLRVQSEPAPTHTEPGPELSSQLFAMAPSTTGSNVSVSGGDDALADNSTSTYAEMTNTDGSITAHFEVSGIEGERINSIDWELQASALDDSQTALIGLEWNPFGSSNRMLITNLGNEFFTFSSGDTVATYSGTFSASDFTEEGTTQTEFGDALNTEDASLPDSGYSDIRLYMAMRSPDLGYIRVYRLSITINFDSVVTVPDDPPEPPPEQYVWRNLVINPSGEQSYNVAWEATNGIVETEVTWEI